MKTGVELIANERYRQVTAEGYSIDHDVEHKSGEILAGAIAYAILAQMQGRVADLNKSNLDLVRQLYWPWSDDTWKPKDQISNLVRAGALIAAEIDRLNRLG